MMDKSHCVMNMEDEEEYLDFYDFSKTYENHPLLIKEEEGKEAKEPSVIKEEREEQDQEEEWEECELNDEDI
jgi:hypothetical protein